MHYSWEGMQSHHLIDNILKKKKKHFNLLFVIVLISIFFFQYCWNYSDNFWSLHNFMGKEEGEREEIDGEYKF